MEGDETAFVALLEQNKTILLKVTRGYCHKPSDREDLTQDIIAQLWRSFKRYDDRSKFSTWMYRVALNVAISFYRRETRRAQHTAPASESFIESIMAHVETSNDDDDGNLRQLQYFIGRLDELNRALMILYLDGKPHEEIAAILGISATNVATKIGRIKERLRTDVLAAQTT